MAENNEKKLIIDDDWKAQAQKEKEDLAKEQEKGGQETEHERQLPPANFAGMVSMLATQALFALGVIAEEKGKARPADLPLAQYHIELLSMLEEKTRGNLTDEEKDMLTGALYQLRMTFVKIAQAMGIKPQ